MLSIFLINCYDFLSLTPLVVRKPGIYKALAQIIEGNFGNIFQFYNVALNITYRLLNINLFVFAKTFKATNKVSNLINIVGGFDNF